MMIVPQPRTVSVGGLLRSLLDLWRYGLTVSPRASVPQERPDELSTKGRAGWAVSRGRALLPPLIVEVLRPRVGPFGRKPGGGNGAFNTVLS